MSDRLYCTLAEFLSDLGLPGVRDEEAALARVQAASDWIDRELGWFIPVSGARTFDGRGTQHLWIDPATAITSVTEGGDAVDSSYYYGFPHEKHWENGPYSRLSVADDINKSVWAEGLANVEVTGRWGLYDKSIATGTTVQNNPLASGGTSLLVANGAKVSPGAVLLIESEQVLVTATGAATDSTTNTNEALDASEEEIDVVSGAALSIGEIIRVELEQMKVLDIASNTVAVARGWNETKRVSHLTNQDIYVYRTFTIRRAANGTTAAAHNQGTAISRQVPPGDVNWLCRQIAGLMLKKAQSGFAGKVGNAELGETFYLNEFPNDVINRISKAHRIVSL